MYCYVRDCPNGLKSLKKKKDSELIKYFPAPEDKNLLEKWRRVIPNGEKALSPNDKLCDSHFLASEVLWFTETKLPNGNVRRLLRDEPILRPGTIPSIFPAEKLEKENATLSGKEKQGTPKPSVLGKERSVTPKSIVKNTNASVREKIETPKSNFRIRFKDPVESSGKRNPQRVKRRSTILDDYWTDDELNQVHNPGRASSGSAKKRKTESGLQPVIRLVPLECLMDKSVSKSKTPCKPVVGIRPSTEEIDLELRKVIEIPLLTSLKPNKSLAMRSTKETVQFKPPKKNVSKSRMRIMANSEPHVSHDDIIANTSEGFNEVKTETPDIEEELARMEMDEESEDVKSSDIIMTDPTIEDDGSVVVKSEEDDDGYSVNEGMENAHLNFPDGNEMPTIKSESEEELPAAEVCSGNTSDDFSEQNQPIPENEAAAAGEQEPALPTESLPNDALPTDNISTTLEKSSEAPEVPAEAEQSKDIDENGANESELAEKSVPAEPEVAGNSSSNERTEEGEDGKTLEEKSHREEEVEGKEKDITAEPSKEVEAEVPTEVAMEEVDAGKSQDDLVTPDKAPAVEKDFQGTQEVEREPERRGDEPEPERRGDESAMETEPSQEVEPQRKEDESSTEIEKEPLPCENNEETANPVEKEEIPKPVESETSQVTEEEMETTEDGKDCGAAVEGSRTDEMERETSEPSGTEVEKNQCENKEIPNEDESRSNDVDSNMPDAGDEADGGSAKKTDNGSITNETDKGEAGAIITINDEPPKPDTVIDVSDSEGVEADKGSIDDAHQEDDRVIDVDPAEEPEQPSSGDKEVSIQESSAPQEVGSEKDSESAMETENCGDPANEESTIDIADDSNSDASRGDGGADVQSVEDDDTHLDASSVGDNDIAEDGKDTEIEKKDSRPAEQLENDEELDIEAEVARLVSEVAEDSPKKKVEIEEGAAKETTSQEIVLQDTTNLGEITAAGVQNLISTETIQEILKQIKLPLTTPVTFRIGPPPTTTPSSGRGRGRRKGMRGGRRQVVARPSSSRESSQDSIDLFRHLTRTRTVFDFPTFIPDVDDDIQYWKLCQILKESFHELIETRNTKTSIGKLTLRVALNRPKKSKVQQNNGESGSGPQ